MKKISLNYLIIAIFAVSAVFTSCDKNKDDDKEPPKDPLTHDKGVVINGVKWATRNVDKPGTFAHSAESSGMLYQWGRNIGWSSTDPLVSSSGSTIWNVTAYVGDVWVGENCPCPKGWRMPTSKELEKLIEIGGEWTTINGIYGRKFENDNNLLFLSATIARDYQKIEIFMTLSMVNIGVVKKTVIFWHSVAIQFGWLLIYLLEH